MLNINANILGAKGRRLPYPVQLNPVLYLSKTNGKFVTSVDGSDTYVNEWIDPYTGKKATQTTGDYRPKLVSNGVEFDGADDYLNVSAIDFTSSSFTICVAIRVSNISSDSFRGLIGEDYTPGSYTRIYYRSGIHNEIAFCNRYNDKIEMPYDFVSTDQFVYLTLIVDNSIDIDNVEFFINNTSIGVGDLANTESIIKKIGTYNDNTGVHYGYLDEISMFDRVLSRFEITDIFNYTKQLKGI